MTLAHKGRFVNAVPNTVPRRRRTFCFANDLSLRPDQRTKLSRIYVSLLRHPSPSGTPAPMMLYPMLEYHGDCFVATAGADGGSGIEMGLRVSKTGDCGGGESQEPALSDTTIAGGLCASVVGVVLLVS